LKAHFDHLISDPDESVAGHADVWTDTIKDMELALEKVMGTL
jgi:hypothetical protein